MIATQPTTEEIAKRAYELYLERGGQPGNETEDWLRAEKELLAQQQAVSAPAPSMVIAPSETPGQSPRVRPAAKNALGLGRKRSNGAGRTRA